MAVTIDARGLVLTEHEFSVPLDHAAPEGERITVFAREVAEPEGREKPFLVFLAGGPGFEAPRPSGNPRAPGWLGAALRDFRVLLLDQRGTGRSTPVGTLPGLDAEAQAAYLTHFRADAIVHDCEHIRGELGVERWSVLGQSFGGLCVTTYLSFAPQGLREALITAGLPPLGRPADEVYEHTWRRILTRNEAYYARYPGDRERVRALVARFDRDPARLPSGDWLNGRRLRQLGGALGMSDGPEAIHHVLELDPGSPAFLHDVEAATSYARNPLYAVVHEASWADGTATRWAADRTMPDAFRQRPELLTGEHILPWMFAEQGALAPLRAASELLADREWPALYDPARLAANDVPVAAAVYADDPYVERTFSEETAGRIRGLRVWLTNEYLHNGLRADGERILRRLLDLARGRG